jgi:hypothetical protein
MVPPLRCRLQAKWHFKILSTIETFSSIQTLINKFNFKVKYRIKISGRSTKRQRRGQISIMGMNLCNTTQLLKAHTTLWDSRVTPRKQRSKSRSRESIKQGSSNFLMEHICQSTRALRKRTSATSQWRVSTKQGKKEGRTDWRQDKLIFWWELMFQLLDTSNKLKENRHKRATLNSRSAVSQWITIKFATFLQNRPKIKIQIDSYLSTNKLGIAWRLGRDSRTWRRKRRSYRELQLETLEMLILTLGVTNKLSMRLMLSQRWLNMICRKIGKQHLSNKKWRCRRQTLSLILKVEISLLNLFMPLICQLRLQFSLEEHHLSVLENPMSLSGN